MKALVLLTAAMCVLQALVASERRLCPVTWERYIEYCYKVLLSVSDVDSYEKARQRCKQEEPDAELSLVLDSVVHYHLVNLLKKNGAKSTMLGINDIEYQDYHLWHDRTMLNFSKWDDDIADPIENAIITGNTDDINCLEITDDGQWNAVACEDVAQSTIICQKPCLSGLICNINGERFEL